MTPTSLELSKRLHEAGIKVESEFSWVKYDEFYEDFSITPSKTYDHRTVPATFESIPAPLACELVELLPAALERTATWLNIRRQWSRENSGNFYVEYIPDDGEPDATHHGPFFAPTLADAVAEMVLHLNSKGLLK